MFEKNIEAIRLKNAELAAKLEKIDIDKISNVDVFEAESKDLIISYNDVPLHNTIDPVRESRTTWNKTVKSELRKHDVQVVFGLGLGYLFKRAYVSANSKVFIYEPFLNVLRFVFEHVDFSNEFLDERVYITDNLSDLLEKIQSTFLSGDKLEFLFLNSYVALAKDDLLTLTGKAVELCESKGVDQNTIFNLCKLWTINSVRNIPYLQNSNSLKPLEDKFIGKPALIISAGPSLAENLEKIKANKDKFVIIAVDAALRVLTNAGVVPDFVCYADADHLWTKIDGLEEFIAKTNVVTELRADNRIYNKQAKQRFVYFSETDAIAQWLSSGTEVKAFTLNKSGGTVSILCYHLAKLLGCKEIAFVGLDLAFIDNKIYANGEELQVSKNGDIELGYPLNSPKKVKNVKGLNGEMIPSRDDYAAFIRQFEDIFENETQIELINLSKSGALIKGMKQETFENFASKFTGNVNVEQVINESVNISKANWKKFTDCLSEKLNSQKETINEIGNSSTELKTELEEICELFEEQEYRLDLLQSKVEKVKDKLNNIRDSVIGNAFLSYYLQAEIWHYTQNYKTSIMPSIEDVKHNMNVELEFVKIVQESTRQLTEQINESLNNQQNKSPVLK